MPATGLSLIHIFQRIMGISRASAYELVHTPGFPAFRRGRPVSYTHLTWPFENDTSAITKKLAKKSLQSEKRRNLMVVIAVALASCLICFSIVMALSTRQIEKNHVEDTLSLIHI